MKKFLSPLLLISVITMGLFLTSCKDTPTVPSLTEQETNFPSETGNYWVYQNILVDKTTKVEDPTQKYIDSVYATEAIYGANDTIYKHKTTIDVKNEMQLNATVINSFKYQNSKLNADLSYIFPSQVSIFNTMKSFLGGYNLTDMIVIADYKAILPWVILPEIKFDSINLPISSYNVKLSNIRYTINGAKGITTPVVVGTQTVNATEFIVTHNIKADAILTVSGIPLNFPIDLNLLIKSYYAKNYGLVKKVLEPASVAVPVMGTVPLTDGYNTTLLRYNIKQ
ncbi:MAG: hypothetical protein WCR42_14570 [bacterium]